jgi:hypothetical protein
LPMVQMVPNGMLAGLCRGHCGGGSGVCCVLGVLRFLRKRMRRCPDYYCWCCWCGCWCCCHLRCWVHC